MPEVESNRTHLFNNSTAETSRMDSDALAFDIHEQYLDQLYRQFNIEVNHALLFYLSNEVDPVIFVDQQEINVGRSDAMGRVVPEFDLESFSARENGVSRLHAQIIFDGEHYVVQDLHSTNGTWLNGQKLIPYEYHRIEDGSTVQFARIAMTAFVIHRS